MTEEVSQRTERPAPQKPFAEQQPVADSEQGQQRQHNGDSNKTGYHNKQNQPRNSRYGQSHKYNNYNGNGQYARYNNGQMGNGHKNYYKAHRGNTVASAAAINAMSMQWAHYGVAPPMYYVPPQMAGVNGGSPMEMSSPGASSVPSALPSGATTPVSKKVEITTKTGEHLDLKEIHSKHLAHKTGDMNASPVPAAPAKEAEASDSKVDDKTDENEEVISEAEKTRRMFVEQAKLRKAALQKKKQDEELKQQQQQQKEEEPAKEEQAAPETESKTPQPVVQEDEQKSSVESEADSTKKPLTFAEKIKLKKQSQEPENEVSAEPLPPQQPKEQPAPAETTIETEEKTAEVTQEEPKLDKTEEIPASETQEKVAESVEGAETIVEKVEEDGEVEKTNDGETKEAEAPVDSVTVTQFLEILHKSKPIEDIYSFGYPEGTEAPDSKYKKQHLKYTYGPTFLLQFKDKVKTTADEEWIKNAASKIVIPPGMARQDRNRDARFAGGNGGGRMGNNDFRRSGSMRNMDGRSNSRNSSKRKSKRDDRRSNRSYTSRKDRERAAEKEEIPKEDVAPLVPSANRWVPKSKQQQKEKKMAPDGVTELLDAEEAKKKMKSLLNKLTLEKFDPISSEVIKIANQSQWETNGETVKIVIEEIFIKACDEPHWTSMYAQLCGKLVKELNPDIADENNEGKVGPKLVLHYLVARCHTEFDKGWTDKLPTNPDGTPLEVEMMSDEYYKLAAAKRRGLGLVRLIGFLYRLCLLTGKMMFECFRRLMKDITDSPTEETLESVVELLNTVGERFEHDSFSTGQATLEGSALLDSLFGILQDIIDNGQISSRIKFKLIDIKELREDKHWRSDKKDNGPKTIQQIHDEEERQRLLKSSNSRASSRRMNSSMGGSGNGTGRNSSRREPPAISKDNFITTRSSSTRLSQKAPPKEEAPKTPMAASNMFSALMGSDEEEE